MLIPLRALDPLFLTGFQVDKLQEWVSPLRTGVHTATFPCVSVSAMWAFLPLGSDVCLMLRIICEHGLLFFFFFYQLVLTPG